MRTLSAGLANHYAQEVTTLATCWKLSRTDGVIMGFTDHDQAILFESVEYQAATGFTPTAIAATASLSVDNLDVEGMLSDESITEADVMAGVYDFAEIEIFQLNYKNSAHGKVILRRGWLGEISLKKGKFFAEVRGVGQKLSQQIGSFYAAGCRAQLGDDRCKVSLGAYTVTGSLSAVSSNSVFADSSRSEENGYFLAGRITFTSGNNLGLSMEIKEFAAGQFVLVMPMPYAVEAGDDYAAVAGCGKVFSTCVARFNNAVNFRGEPHVPGLDRMLETSTTRSEW